MAAEALIDYIRPSFPKKETNESGIITRIEYVGPTATLAAALPAVGDTWGDYPGNVSSVSIEPTDDVDTSVVMIGVDVKTDNENAQPGELKSISYEIRWVTVERSMYEHPQFDSEGNGANKLTSSEIAEIKAWESPDNPAEFREKYQYRDEFKYLNNLSDNARLFARGIELGLESYEDKAPVAIKISEYVNGPPPKTDAGLKDDPIGFPNLPDGFEWRKQAADSTRAGNQTRWTLTEEWEGAKKILYDRERVYWELPPSFEA
jgi:hypothetical protein